MTLRRNILIFHQGALGDFIVTWPLALALARLHPQSRVFYVTQGQKGALAEKVLRVESMDIESGAWHLLHAEAPAPLPAASAKALSGAHTILNFVSGENDPWARNVRSVNPETSLLTLSTAAPQSFASHQSEFFVEQLAVWPAAQSAARQILRSIAERGLGPVPSPDGPVVIHPGGGAAQKCWPAEHYLELAKRLREQGRRVRVLLGEVEMEQWAVAQIEKFRKICEVLTPPTLTDLLSAVVPVSVFIGNDSGPGHLAGILGVPTLSLFGTTSNPLRWKPLGPRVKVLHEAIDSLSVDTVLHATEQIASK